MKEALDSLLRKENLRNYSQCELCSNRRCSIQFVDTETSMPVSYDSPKRNVIITFSTSRGTSFSLCKVYVSRQDEKDSCVHQNSVPIRDFNHMQHCKHSRILIWMDSDEGISIGSHHSMLLLLILLFLLYYISKLHFVVRNAFLTKIQVPSGIQHRRKTL